MTLFFSSGSRDQALLTLVVQEAENTRRINALGRTNLQKVMYFLQVIGVPMDYNFTVHHYGPFCSEILQDTETLLADDVIRDRSSDPARSAYVTGSSVSALLAQHATFLEGVRKRVSNVVSVLAPLRPRRLELLATVHYCFRLELAVNRRGPWKAGAAERVREFKQAKFSYQEISTAYDQLASAGLIREPL